ncbi:PEP-CTERM sorting domain-containing protein, partial [Microcystis aeruginosa]
MTNYGASSSNNRIGFSEIQFRSIPEPSSTLALLALGLGGVGLR